MKTRWTWTVGVALGGLLACGTDVDRSGADDSATSGKADSQGIDAAECSLDPSAPRSLTQFVNNNHVQFRCRGPSGAFVPTGCCADEIEEFTFATGCPLQAKFNAASGSQRRCVQDSPTAGEQVSGELFVPTVCCQLLCDPAARWDDPMQQDACRDSAGRFHPHVCCMMNDDLRCGDASFDQQPDSLGFRHCRVGSGDFAGQFAPAACCVDACFDILEAGQEDIPIECLLPLEDECEGAAIDGQGICRGPDGRFAKGLCCLGQQGLDVQQSDNCRLADLTGQDLSGCL